MYYALLWDTFTYKYALLVYQLISTKKSWAYSNLYFHTSKTYLVGVGLTE